MDRRSRPPPSAPRPARHPHRSNPMTNNITRIETICRELTASGEPIAFTTIAERSGISRTTLYRDEQLRAVIEEHRHRSHDPRTLASLTNEIAHLRAAVEG